MFKKSYWFGKIKQNPLLYGLGLVWKNRKNSTFLSGVIGLSNNEKGLSIHFGNLGDYNAERYIEFIDVESATHGFFACVRDVLELLVFADRFNLTPVIQFKNTRYNEDHAINGTENAFEYYFQQPSSISVEEALQSRHVFETTLQSPRAETMSGYGLSHEQMQLLASMYRKYIRLNQPTKLYMDEQIQDLLKGKRTLGVHYRGTDFGYHFKDHPVFVKAVDSLLKARQVFEEYGFERIFLATDDVKALSEFQTEFGDALLFYPDVLRSEGNMGVHITEAARKDHHYLIGLEVLRDMLTLGSCEGLIAGLSQVSYAAQIAKLAEGKEYLPLYIFDNGINHTGSVYSENLTKELEREHKKRLHN